MEQLNQIFSKYLSENKNDYEKSFKCMAELLLHGYNLVVERTGSKPTVFELIEIEVYYQDKNHDDESIHFNQLQQESNKWYVHNKGRGGIDITFGDGKSYGGILIRGIKKIDPENKKDDSKKYINGPINVIDEILKISGVNYQALQGKKVFSNPLKLKKKDNKDKISKDTLIYQGPRVGLTKPDNYLVSPYRYVVNIKPKHKFKEKECIYAYSLRLNPLKSEKIKSNIGYKFNIDKFLKRMPANVEQKSRKKKIVDYLNQLQLNPPQT